MRPTLWQQNPRNAPRSRARAVDLIPPHAVTLAIEELGFGRRIQVLQELGMWTGERSAMGQDELIRSAAEQLVDEGRIDEFNDAVARARS